MVVKDIIRNKGDEVVSIDPASTVADAIASLNEHNIGALIVLEDGLKGIITERDILRLAGTRDTSFWDRPVHQAMTKELFSCTPEQSLDQVMAVMTQERIRHLPVVQNDELAGIISIGDVVKARLNASEAEAEDLKQYIHGRR